MELPDNPNSKVKQMKKAVIEDLTQANSYELRGRYRYLIDVGGEDVYYVSASTEEQPFYTVSSELPEDVTMALAFDGSYYLVPYREVEKDAEEISVSDGNFKLRMIEEDGKLKFKGKLYEPLDL